MSRPRSLFPSFILSISTRVSLIAVTGLAASPAQATSLPENFGQCHDTDCCPAGHSIIQGGSGSDQLLATTSNVCLLGHGSSDGIFRWQGSGTGVFLGGSADDNLSALGFSGAHTMYGGSGGDNISGGNNDDILVGGAGGDNISGGPGDDLIYGGGEGVDASDFANNLSGGSGHDRLYAGDAGDVVSGDSGDDELFAGAGVDRLDGGAGNDTIHVGDGADVVLAGSGDDRIVFEDACRVSPGTSIDGGPGFDRLESPFDEAQLAALGVSVQGIEDFVHIGDRLCAGNGQCVSGPDDTTSCVCDPGWDGPSCSHCAPGFHFAGPRGTGKQLTDVLPDRDDEPGYVFDLAAAGVTCEADVTCADLDCGPAATCRESEGTAQCECPVGLAGNDCSACDTHWQLDAGACILGDECARERCNGRGQCVADPADASIGCACDPNFTGEDCLGGAPKIELVAPFVREGESEALGALNIPAACEPLLVWSREQGPGSIVDTPSGPRYQLDPGELDPSARIDHASVRLQAPGCAEPIDLSTDIPLLPAHAPPIHGETSATLEGIDELALEFLEDNPEIPGINIGVAHSGRAVYAKSFGFRDRGRNEALEPHHRMRLASVTKSVTRAAFRTMLHRHREFDIDDRVIETLVDQGWAEELLNLDDDGKTILPNRLDHVGRKVDRAEHSFDIRGYRMRPDTAAQIRKQRLDECYSRDRDEIDPAWEEMTFQHLMDHRMGLDRGISDATFDRDRLYDKHVLGHEAPYNPVDRLHLGIRTCLVNRPGAVPWADGYSNWGYVLLGELVRKMGEEVFDQSMTFLDVVHRVLLVDLPQFEAGRTAGDALDEVEYQSTDSDGSRFDPECIGGTDDKFCDAGNWTFPHEVEKAYGVIVMEGKSGDGVMISTACAVADYAQTSGDNGKGWERLTPGSNSGALSGSGTRAEVRWIPKDAPTRGPVTAALIINGEPEEKGATRALMDRIQELLETTPKTAYPDALAEGCPGGPVTP